jgi:hypothetical protein
MHSNANFLLFCENWVLSFSNVVIRICAAGLVVIGVGAHIQIAAAHYLDFLADTYLNTPIFIIIAGQIGQKP